MTNPNKGTASTEEISKTNIGNKGKELTLAYEESKVFSEEKKGMD